MAVNAVQKNNGEDLRRQSFLKSGATGAVFGYALKWAIPILPQEESDVLDFQKKLPNDFSKSDVVSYTKSLRPAHVFLSIGFVAGILSALVHNVYVENAKRNLASDNIDLIV